MASASAYILLVPHDRRKILLEGKPSSVFGGGWDAAEPVEKFDHSRTVPLLLLASFENGFITHVADARKGMSAGTGLVRLNMRGLEQLSSPIAFGALIDRLKPRYKSIVKKILEAGGGLLPPATLKAVITALQELDPDISERLRRLSEERARRISAIPQKAKENLALQKEALTTALQAAGVSTEMVLEWEPSAELPTSFLAGLPQAYAREDLMINADFNTLPGFSVIESLPHVYAKTFASHDNPSNRVTVVMANRLALEQQTGADLIYFNEQYRCFVMVQYKALEKRNETHEFRWTAGDDFENELSRMDAILSELERSDVDADPDGFRFSPNPFFLKFCPRVVFNPDDKAMFAGLYIPHGLWKALANSQRLKGSAGGSVLTPDNVGRKITNPEFLMLLSGAWVGTTMTQSNSLETLIRAVVESGRTLTFAVKRSPGPEPISISTPIEDGPEFEELLVTMTTMD